MNLVFKFLYQTSRASSSLWHWLRRRFTLPGFCVAGTLLAAGAVGLDVEDTVTYQAFMLLLALLLPAFVCSWFFRAKFSVTRLLPRLGTAGRRSTTAWW